MSDDGPPKPVGRVRSGGPYFLLFSCAAHAALLIALRDAPVPEDNFRLELPARIEFGIVAAERSGGAPAAAPPPAKVAAPKRADKPARTLKPPPDPHALPQPVEQPAAEPEARETKSAASAMGEEGDAARSGEGTFEGAIGDGSGAGLGDGFAPAGATLALNVDLARVRSSSLLLESTTLLDMIPEWQMLLVGSGLDPLKDLDRVFVATPNLERASLVVSARHHLSRARIAAAVQQLATEQHQPAQFQQHAGIDVAPWHNRGPTERVIALTGRDQFVISRATDLTRVLSVAAALARVRTQQGFEQGELSEQGGLLAMQPNEAVALWIEDVASYVPARAEGVPRSLRLSIYHIDQFNSELRVRGQYASATAAAAAKVTMDELRARLSDDPKIVFLGLKSALDAAQIEQAQAALSLHVRLTLHQTRYLLRYVNRVLHRSRS